MKSDQGFSLIEMLVSIVIMGVLVTAILAPLSQLFRNTQSGGQTLQATTHAQNVLEFVRGQWKPYPRVLDDGLANTDPEYRQDQNREERAESRRRYDSTCFDATGLTVPSGLTYSIVVNSVDRGGILGNALPLKTSCTSATVTARPPLTKQITVTVNGPDNQRTVLAATVARP